MKCVLFISREKDNRGITGYKRREEAFVYDTDEQGAMTNLAIRFVNFVKMGVQNETCRMYTSVNPRDMTSVRIELIHHMIDHPQDDLSKMESIVCSIAMRKEFAMGRKWLIDFDSESIDQINEFITELKDTSGFGVEEMDIRRTPNGFAIVTPRGFDSRELMQKWGNVAEIKRDAMLFELMAVNDVVVGE